MHIIRFPGLVQVPDLGELPAGVRNYLLPVQLAYDRIAASKKK